MAEVNQEVAVLLPILPLLLESRLGMTEDNFFRSTHTIDREGYQGDNDLRKVISTGVDNQLEDIDRNWIQHIYITIPLATNISKMKTTAGMQSV